MASESWQEIRPASAVAIPVVAWVVIGFGAADIVWRGTAQERLDYLPWLAVVALAVHLVLWAPRVRVGRDAVESREVLRTFTIPYGAITDIRASGVLRITYTDAAGRRRTLRPWNSPSPRTLGRPQPGSGRAGRLRGAKGEPSLPRPPVVVSPEQALLDRWRDHEGAAGVPSARWHVVELAALAVLLAVAALV